MVERSISSARNIRLNVRKTHFRFLRYDRHARVRPIFLTVSRGPLRRTKYDVTDIQTRRFGSVRPDGHARIGRALRARFFGEYVSIIVLKDRGNTRTEIR